MQTKIKATVCSTHQRDGIGVSQTFKVATCRGNIGRLNDHNSIEITKVVGCRGPAKNCGGCAKFISIRTTAGALK